MSHSCLAHGKRQRTREEWFLKHKIRNERKQHMVSVLTRAETWRLLLQLHTEFFNWPKVLLLSYSFFFSRRQEEGRKKQFSEASCIF